MTRLGPHRTQSALQTSQLRPASLRRLYYDNRGDKVRFIESIAKPASTPKTGLFALLRVYPRVEGISAPRAGLGSGAPNASLALLTALVLAALLVVPAVASAYATIEGPPVYSSAPGLPDGRVYEQVSPADKSGNEAGAVTFGNVGGEEHYGLAAADGNSVLFEGTGPMGETATAVSPYFVASKNRGGAGWTTRSVTPRTQQGADEIGTSLAVTLADVYPSSDLSHAMFQTGEGGEYALPPGPIGVGCEEVHGRGQIYLAGSDPFVPATWLERPAPTVENPIYNCNIGDSGGAPVGGTPDFSTVYFAFAGTLLPEDASRVPHAQANANGATEAWGFYEDREGVLREAGVLPEGGLDPFGAVPAVSGHARALVGNQVSADGSRAFFVSPDPASCTYNGGLNNCAADPPELYVRENGEETLLVSRDTLLPAAGGLPVAAPSGVVRTLNAVALPHEENDRADDGSYVFASPDGSQAFFQSADDLTRPAEEASPGSEPKTYDFDLNTGALTYLPNVSGRIVETDTNGSAFAFLRAEIGSSPRELDLWSAGPDGGSVTSITQMSGKPEITEGVERAPLARMSSDGSVLVFATDSSLSSAFNSGGFKQIYRYDVPTNTLGCISCPPHGVTPTGNVSMSTLQLSEEGAPGGNGNNVIRGEVDGRGISADGSRIFFDTPDPLVPQDANTGSTFVDPENGEQLTQGRDLYEWENGVIYLISTGKSPLDSYFLDNSENGDDVFFTTAEGLVPGDTDGAYDVYDARVPHRGDNPPPAAVPCEGAVCQGPPNVPSPLTPPASATFSGLGNPASAPAATPVKPKATPKATKCKRGYVKRKSKCVKTKTKTQAKKSDNRSGK